MLFMLTQIQVGFNSMMISSQAQYTTYKINCILFSYKLHYLNITLTTQGL